MINTILARINFSILLPAILLVVLGLATLYSIDPSIFKQQLSVFGVALIGYFLFLNINYRFFGAFAKYLYFIMVGLLTILFIIGIEAKGSIRWVDIFGIRIQFSEIIKPFFIIFMAYFVSKTESRSFVTFIKALLLLFPIFFLTLKQPDLGNAVIYLVVTVFMLFLAGFPLKYFLIVGISTLVPMPFLFNFLHDYQKERILSFFNVTSDPFGSSYNAIQALISVGSGRFFGNGFGQATQSLLKFLPERHTDFIFATLSESLGFLGGTALILLYAFLLYKIYSTVQTVDDEFSRLIVIGFFSLLLIHVFFNIGMNIGILPIVGITLPLVSYGGSSLLTNFIVLGILSSISFEFKRRNSFEIR